MALCRLPDVVRRGWGGCGADSVYCDSWGRQAEKGKRVEDTKWHIAFGGNDTVCWDGFDCKFSPLTMPGRGPAGSFRRTIIQMIYNFPGPPLQKRRPLLPRLETRHLLHPLHRQLECHGSLGHYDGRLRIMATLGRRLRAHTQSRAGRVGGVIRTHIRKRSQRHKFGHEQAVGHAPPDMDEQHAEPSMKIYGDRYRRGSFSPKDMIVENDLIMKECKNLFFACIAGVMS